MTEGVEHRADTLEFYDVLPVGLCDLSEGSLSSRPAVWLWARHMTLSGLQF